MEAYQISYIIGRQLASAGVYFNQTGFYMELKSHPDERVQKNIARLEKHLENLSLSFVEQLRNVNNMTEALDLSPPAVPVIPPQYASWASNIHQRVVERLAPDPKCNSLYLFGICVGEMLTCLSTICFLLEFHKKLNISYQSKVKQCLAGMQTTMQKWTKLVGQHQEDEAMNGLARFWMRINNEAEIYIENFSYEDQYASEGRSLAASVENEEQKMLQDLQG